MIRDTHVKLTILAGIAILIGVAFFFVPPIPQSLAYHNFADRRIIFRIPNFCDVASNIPFALVGVMGMIFLLGNRARRGFEHPSERWAYLLFFAALVLSFAGSSYYHLHPDNETLVWDRLPMSIGFMAIFSAVLAETVDVKIGTRLLVPLIALGIASVLVWHATELRGAGDLRFYVVVQFFPMLAIPLMVLFFSNRYTHSSYLLVLAGFYLLAKLLEYFDHAVFSASHILSGHTLKHLASALGTFWVLKMLRDRNLAQDLLSSKGFAEEKAAGIAR